VDEGSTANKVLVQNEQKEYIMSRRNGAVLEETDAPEVEAIELDETEEVEEVAEGDAPAEKAPKAKKEPARGDLPEGYVTPVGLAKILSERNLHQNRAGETVPVPPQMVYSYIRNAPKDQPFPLEVITDSLGKERSAVNVDKAVEWWTAKNERAGAKKANAAAKAQAKAEKSAAKPAEETVDEAEGAADEAVTEAE
jgi:hypothetical protein